MVKFCHLGFIEYLQKKSLATKDIHTDIVATLGDDALDLYQVQEWAAEFKWGRKNLGNDPRSEHPATVPTEENIDRLHRMAMDDRRMTINQIVNANRIWS